jgi:ferric-dicitrate binding protein FerR (iron transport regulator)
MIDGRMILVQREQYEEYRRQADAHRRAREIAGVTLAARALVWLGRRLEAWGDGLQRRYGTAQDAQSPCCVNGSVS